MTVTYSGVDDLLIGDLRLSDPGIRYAYVQSAAKEIHAKLGVVYEIPFTALDDHSYAYLSDTSNKIASGRLIMSVAIAGEDSQVNPYGRYLLREGQAQLDALASLQILLDGAVRRTDRDDSRLPIVRGRDDESPTKMFEDSVMRGEPSYWQPGSVP